jgi:hypothetical protein
VGYFGFPLIPIAKDIRDENDKKGILSFQSHAELVEA